MKSSFVLASVFAALSGFAGLTSTARAGADIDIHIGLPHPPAIVIGGRDHDHHRHDRYRDDHRGHHAPRGFWKEVTVKSWIPGRWVTRCDRFGHEIRVRERGHYVYRTERVWVGGDRDHRRHARR